jgi:hypothetical protein
MAGLDELFAQIPVQDIASKLGADEGEVNNAVRTLVPALVGGLQQNAQNDDAVATEIHSAASKKAGLLDGGVSVDKVDEQDGDKAIAKIFGGNDSNTVASALAGGGAGNSDLLKRLLPILAPIVLAYIGKQLTGSPASAPAQTPAAPSGGLGEVLGSILGGAGGGGGSNPLGSILGSVLGGGGQSNAIGEILGGLLGGKK